MIIPPGPLKVLVATRPVDFRKGMIGLASLVERELRLDPFSGMLFIFRSRRADRIKLLVWDGTGLVLVTKRLHEGKFRWPRPGDGVMKLSGAQASALIEGLGLKPRVAYGPLRVAVSGRRVSPPLFESLELLGKAESIRRLAALVQRVG